MTPRHDHPRPQLRRSGWVSLDGLWQFALDAEADLEDPADVSFDRSIVVPFAPETAASGIACTGWLRRCWYRREIEVPDLADGERWLLHFGAVDREATVWIDGHRVGHHVGGSTPFTCDITTAGRLAPRNGTVSVVVRADDRPIDVAISRGKQDWRERPHMIWYPRTTGIWQTVWHEVVPPVRVTRLVWEGDPSSMTLTMDLTVAGRVTIGDTVRVRISRRDRTLVDDRITITDVVDGAAALRRVLSVGSHAIDDPFDLVWRPHRPVLLDAEISVDGARGSDVVTSYAAIRSVGVRHGRFELNGKPYFLRMALDQGYWAESGMTAPSLDALQADVELARALGFNGVRKHQKIEDPRWLALCDELGLLVWEELPSAYSYSPVTLIDLASEWMEVIERDRSHPCVVTWVPFNESWGVPDVVHRSDQAAAVAALAHITHALDPSRPVSANDGWETVGGDIAGVHDYDQDAGRVADRYRNDAALDVLFADLGPAQRPLAADRGGRAGRAVVLSEFGGCTLSESRADLFSYDDLSDPGSWLDRVRDLCHAASSSSALSGFCWTQLTDTYQEANGLVRMDRSPKLPPERIAAAVRGLPDPGDG